MQLATYLKLMPLIVLPVYFYDTSFEFPTSYGSPVMTERSAASHFPIVHILIVAQLVDGELQAPEIHVAHFACLGLYLHLCVKVL